MMWGRGGCSLGGCDGGKFRVWSGGAMCWASDVILREGCFLSFPL